MYSTRGVTQELPYVYSIFYGYYDMKTGMFISIYEFAFGVFIGVLMLAGSVMTAISLIKMFSKKTI